jgi:hypothetical protein
MTDAPTNEPTTMELLEAIWATGRLRQTAVESRRLRALVGVRLTPDELLAGRELAEMRGMSLPGLMRQALRDQLVEAGMATP